jgi:hypothetical protein
MRKLKFALILLLFINIFNNVKANTINSSSDTIWLSSKSTDEQYINEIIRLKVDNKIKDETIKNLQSKIKETNSSYNFYKWFFYIVLSLILLIFIGIIIILSWL